MIFLAARYNLFPITPNEMFPKLLLFLAVCLCFGFTSSRKKPLEVTLSVLNQVSYQPIRGAKVAIEAIEGSFTVNLDAADSGYIKLTLETNSAYKLKVSHPDFLTSPELLLQTEETAIQQKIFLAPLTEGLMIRWAGIDFDLLSGKVSQTSRLAWQKLATFLEDNERVVVELGCHTSSLGRDKVKAKISTQRAKSLRQVLIDSAGIASDRIIAKGYGERHLLNQCNDGVRCTTLENAQNDRVETIIIGF